MEISDLNKNLDNAISTFKAEAGAACNYCDETTGEAFSTMWKATAKALTEFKVELLAYFNQD